MESLNKLQKLSDLFLPTEPSISNLAKLHLQLEQFKTGVSPGLMLISTSFFHMYKDIPQHKNSKIALFADDTLINAESNTINSVTNKIR